MRSIRSIAFLTGLLAATAPAVAQVPVIDSATLSQATQTASNTASIMQTNQQIMQTVQETLKAVTGNRQTGSIASAALGSGFNMSGAPSLSSILDGGQMAWGNLGEFGQVAAGIINGLKLVNTLSGLTGSNATGTDKAYQGAVNTATALQGLVAGTQSAASSRTNAFQAAGGMIGTAQDIKGSIDQNSQLQVQTGLTVNELIGVMNAANAALNAQQMQELAAQAHAAKVHSYNPSSVRLVAP